MGYVQIVIAVLSLMREYLKYRTQQETSAREKAKKIAELKNGLKQARKNNDTSRLETAFTNLGVDLGISSLPDQKNNTLDA